MELFTLNRKFLKQDIIDGFHSAIWTERYYGDSEVELVVPATTEMIKKLPKGIFLSLNGSNEVMILETMSIEEGNLKVLGIALLPWMNNRIVRTNAKHEDTAWDIYNEVPGKMLWTIIFNMCCAGSPYLNRTIDIGIPNAPQLVIPGLGLRDYDKSGVPINARVAFGPVYNAMREIAVGHGIGMQIILESATESSYSLGFRSYKGIDRTSQQTIHPVVRFSPQMESLTDIKEIQSIAALKTHAYVFASNLDDADKPLATQPGYSARIGTVFSGFDLRALMEFATDISHDMIGGDANKLLALLTSQADMAINTNDIIQAVDGEIVPTSQFQYGRDYNLGDIIEIQGNSGVVKTSRVTEYIRAQNEAGERAYPTITMLD